ncbi:MRG family protein, putative isoform 1 [Melia azedarach]|uniref:MRG family protein, putative isoform 1 n=1 Tax=Melia azedarach TaxID=155640 RepID=A0ACC1WTG5_MELAZ|nr:MRG family protein, putative isoform 1 [Melia azedarach]
MAQLKMGTSNMELNDDSATQSDEATKTDADSDTEKTETDDDQSPPSPGSIPYEENERVLAFHNLHVYEAKVRKVEYRTKQWRFFVHYLGWNKNWDEWVGVDRLMKDTEANRHRQQVINKKQGPEKNVKPGRVSQMKPRSSNVGRGKKRKNDALGKEKSSMPTENFLNIQIPPTLKKQLVDDCEFITHLGKLVKLPRTPNVDDILEKYCKYRSKKDGLIADSTGEIVKGLRCYFDKALPIMLLYKSERQQYEEAVAADVSPSTVYGAEHLLRLFVKLPELLVHAKIEEETLMLLQQKLVDFLKFLQKHQSAFFLASYHAAEDVETSTNKQDDD